MVVDNEVEDLVHVDPEAVVDEEHLRRRNSAISLLVLASDSVMLQSMLRISSASSLFGLRPVGLDKSHGSFTYYLLCFLLIY